MKQPKLDWALVRSFLAVAEHGSILNPMHLVHRLPRLQAGQRWKVPLFDPLKIFSAKEIFGQKLPVFSSGAPFLDAEVFDDVSTRA